MKRPSNAQLKAPAPPPFSHRLHRNTVTNYQPLIIRTASNTTSPPRSPNTLQPHVLRLLLVRRVQYCGWQASASAGERRLRQLRRDGEMRPAAAAPDVVCAAGCRSAVSTSVLCVTRCCAGCRVLRERSGGRDHALSVAAHGRGGSGALVATVRMVQRADDVRQLLRRGRRG